MSVCVCSNWWNPVSVSPSAGIYRRAESADSLPYKFENHKSRDEFMKKKKIYSAVWNNSLSNM